MIGLGGTDVTIDGLRQLSALPKLKALFISTTHYKPEDLQQLAQLLPNTEIAHDSSGTKFNFIGTIVHQDGHPLQGVLLSTEPAVSIIGGSKAVGRPVRRVDGTFEISERCKSLYLTFSKEGYLDASYILEGQTPGMVRGDAGDWPLEDNFPVVMLASTPPKALHFSGQIA